MGLLDCVASPEGRDSFDENERPVRRPQELSRSDHDISRRRGLPLFASQTSLKNIRDVDFWRQRVLRFLFSPEGKEDIRILRVPFSQLGFATVTDFICEIPQELFQPYLNEPAPDETLLKEYKVFWVKDGIGEPGVFKWEGRIEKEYCLGLQLDRKKAVPYGIHDGKGLFYCKPGHRAIVPEKEVVPYKKFLRSYLGLPPKKDSLLELRGSVRLSARAIRAKNSKPGDRVYLPKEQKWATVQWIGKINNETVVDLVYERPKSAVSPDEPCISRSMSLADFIGELSSEPNSPTGIQTPPETPPKSSQENSVPKAPPTPLETRAQCQSMMEEQRHSSTEPGDNYAFHSSTEDDEYLDDDDDSNEDSDEEESSSDAEQNYNSDDSEDDKVLPRSKEVEDMTKEPEDKIEVLKEDLAKISTPKRKGFFGFSPKDKNRSKSLPSFQKEEKAKDKIQSELELSREPKSPKTRSKSPNIFSHFRFKKNPKQQKTPNEREGRTGPDEIKSEKEATTPNVNSKTKKSQWQFGLFKSRSKGSLSKIATSDADGEEEAPSGPVETPVDKMIPPDQIPTPPPFAEPEGKFQERKVERPAQLDLATKNPSPNDKLHEVITRPTPPGPPKVSYEEALKQRSEVRLDSDWDSIDSNEEDVVKEVKEAETTMVEMHHRPPRSSSDSSGCPAPGTASLSPTVSEKVMLPESENRKDDFPVYLAICPPYIPPQDREQKSPSPPPVPSSLPPEIDDPEQEWITPEPMKYDRAANEPVPPTKPKERQSPPEPESNATLTSEPTATPEPVQTLLEKFKDSKVRNRPSSFGSFLARIKNQKKVPGEVIKYPNGSSPSQTQDVSAANENAEQHESVETPGFETSPDIEYDPGLQTNANDVSTLESLEAPANFEISRSLIKPKSEVTSKIGVTSIPVDPEGDQDGIMLDLLDVKESTPPDGTPVPPQQATLTPKPKARSSFTFAFPKKRKPSYPQTPTTTTPVSKIPTTGSLSVEELNNDNAENIVPSDNESKEKYKKTRSPSSSFRSSFRRTFSLTRKNKQSYSSMEKDINEEVTQTPRGGESGRPRPVTLYIDNNEVAEQKNKKNSFRNKRPASLVVDIKPWDMRHGTEGVDIYSSPSSEEAPRSPGSLRSPNQALMPKVEIVDIPKHRIFTTPAFFHKNKKKSDISKASQTNYKRFNQPEDSTNENKTNIPTLATPTGPKTPPPLPTSPPPALIKQRPKSTAFETPPTPTTDSQQTKLKSALKQRKEIESIPRGLKIGERVLWYSTQGPIPGTVQRLFKDGTDKYTAMVKFDRDVVNAPLRLNREGDAYIITVEELITPDMFESKPIYANQEQIGLATSKQEVPSSPLAPSVRFNEADSESEPDKEIEKRDLPPPFQEEEVKMACGFRRGIQCRDKSCCLESILFSLFYTTNAFDIAVLYGNNSGEDKMTRNVRKILGKQIVDPLRRNGFVSCQAIMKLREAVNPLSEEWQTMSTDAEVMMFILFDQALKLGKFLTYSNGMSDFLHQLVVDPKDLSRSTTIQHLFETSLDLMEKLKLSTVPTPALILEMPRSNDKLMQYKAIIPNLSLHLSHLLQDGPRLCICGMVAHYDCTECTKNVGRMSIVYCDNCKGTADIIHFQLPHQSQLSPLSQPVVILDLRAIICVSQGHYISFVKCGTSEKHSSPWVYFDGAEIENPKVCIEQNLGMWLDRLEKYPGKYQDALQYPLLTHILQDSHICIYQPREKSSSV